jgi:phosphatidylglycerophosphate synthase
MSISVPNFLLTQRAASFFIFVAASVTDYFDGFLARKLNQQSEFGAFLDPVADKVNKKIFFAPTF